MLLKSAVSSMRNYPLILRTWLTSNFLHFYCVSIKRKILINKKAQNRSWHTAKCSKLYHLTWNINVWDTAIPLHDRHFVRHLGICNPICIKLPQLMSGVITHNSVKKNEVSTLINGWVTVNYSVSRPPFCSPSWNLPKNGMLDSEKNNYKKSIVRQNTLWQKITNHISLSGWNIGQYINWQFTHESNM